MKKLIAIILTLAILIGCTSASNNDGVFEITERFFSAQMFEVFADSQNFLGRTIRYEGMFNARYLDVSNEYIFLVFRYTEGCCFPEEALGFEVYLNDIPPPENDSWVEVTGVLEHFTIDGVNFLRLNVTSLIELEERGLEFVHSL